MTRLEDGEPLAEGFLIWSDHTFELVVNTFDGLVSLGHPNCEPLEELLNVVGGSIRIV
jgi:hypothetical protein